MEVKGLGFRGLPAERKSDVMFLVLGDWLLAVIEWKKGRQSSMLWGIGQYRKGFTSIIDRNGIRD